MNNKIVSLGVLVIAMVSMVSATPTVLAGYPANAVYFEPESINETVQHTNIMVNTSIDTMSVGMDIYFDPSCVNITDVDFTGTPYSQTTGWTYWGDHVRVGAMNFGTAVVSPGTHVVAKLTFECMGGDCTSNVGFSATELTNATFKPIGDATWINGTFTCGTPDCLGDCYDAAGKQIASDVPCYECIGVGTGVSWENYEFDSPCSPGTTVPRRPYAYCPECCDGIDNGEGDTLVDWPADPGCACCLDETEDVDEGCPVECVPELPTLALAGLGILGIALLARKRD
jgi:hypothetical protein